MTTIIDGSSGITLPTGLTLNNPGTWSEFAAGTAILFQQTTAPTGWTKSTTHDNKALRVVSGSASSGGSVAFTTAFASQGVSGSVGNTTLSIAQIPSHGHSGGGFEALMIQGGAGGYTSGPYNLSGGKRNGGLVPS